MYTRTRARLVDNSADKSKSSNLASRKTMRNVNQINIKLKNNQINENISKASTRKTSTIVTRTSTLGKVTLPNVNDKPIVMTNAKNSFPLHLSAEFKKYLISQGKDENGFYKFMMPLKVLKQYPDIFGDVLEKLSERSLVSNNNKRSIQLVKQNNDKRQHQSRSKMLLNSNQKFCIEYQTDMSEEPPSALRNSRTVVAKRGSKHKRLTNSNSNTTVKINNDLFEHVEAIQSKCKSYGRLQNNTIDKQGLSKKIKAVKVLLRKMSPDSIKRSLKHIPIISPLNQERAEIRNSLNSTNVVLQSIKITPIEDDSLSIIEPKNSSPINTNVKSDIIQTCVHNFTSEITKTDLTRVTSPRNNNICAIVDIKHFNLNCYYCSNSYPLANWTLFLEHLQFKHNIESDKGTTINSESLLLKDDDRFVDGQKTDGRKTSMKYRDIQKDIITIIGEESESNEITTKTLNTISLTNALPFDELEAQLSSEELIQILEGDESEITIKNHENKSLAWNETETEIPLETMDSADIVPSKIHSNDLNYNDADVKVVQNVVAEHIIPETLINNSNIPIETEFVVEDDLMEANIISSDDEMPSNDENEDETPKPTQGCGILFGLTNRSVVMDFLKHLEAFPILYLPIPRSTQKAYDKAIISLRFLLNDKYNLSITDFEMRTSIQRVMDWYCSTLNKIKRHNKINADKPFDHRFKLYFEQCAKFLPDSTKDRSLNNVLVVNPFNQHVTYPSWITFATEEEIHDNHVDQISNEEQNIDLESKEPKKYKCDVCGKILSQKATLRTHKFYHTTPKFKCDTCGRAFYRKFGLESHIRNHHKSNTEPYICEYCGKVIYSYGTFRMHKLTAHYNLRYTCVVCNYQTQSQRYLLRHQTKRHLALEGSLEELAKKMKPQGMRLIPSNPEYRDGYLWKMSIRKPGQRIFSCIMCQLVFDRYKDILHHNKQFHPIRHKTYMCLLCPPGKTLMRSSLRRHYTVMHKIPPVELEDLMLRTMHVQTSSTQADIHKLNADSTVNIIEIIQSEKSKYHISKNIEHNNDNINDNNKVKIKEEIDKNFYTNGQDCDSTINVDENDVIDVVEVNDECNILNVANECDIVETNNYDKENEIPEIILIDGNTNTEEVDNNHYESEYFDTSVGEDYYINEFLHDVQ